MWKRILRWFVDFLVVNLLDKECMNCLKVNIVLYSIDLIDFSIKFWLKDFKVKWWYGLFCKMMINWDILDFLYILFVLIRKLIYIVEIIYFVFIFFFCVR